MNNYAGFHDVKIFLHNFGDSRTIYNYCLVSNVVGATDHFNHIKGKPTLMSLLFGKKFPRFFFWCYEYKLYFVPRQSFGIPVKFGIALPESFKEFLIEFDGGLYPEFVLKEPV